MNKETFERKEFEMYVQDMTDDQVMDWIEYLDGDDSQDEQISNDLDDLLQEAIMRDLISVSGVTDTEPTYDPRY